MRTVRVLSEIALMGVWVLYVCADDTENSIITAGTATTAPASTTKNISASPNTLMQFSTKTPTVTISSISAESTTNNTAESTFASTREGQSSTAKPQLQGTTLASNTATATSKAKDNPTPVTPSTTPNPNSTDRKTETSQSTSLAQGQAVVATAVKTAATTTITNPSTTITNPSTTITNPSTTTTNPSTTTTNPSTTTTNPSNTTSNPSTTTTKPNIVINNHSSTTNYPSTGNTNPSTTNININNGNVNYAKPTVSHPSPKTTSGRQSTETKNTEISSHPTSGKCESTTITIIEKTWKVLPLPGVMLSKDCELKDNDKEHAIEVCKELKKQCTFEVNCIMNVTKVNGTLQFLSGDIRVSQSHLEKISQQVQKRNEEKQKQQQDLTLIAILASCGGLLIIIVGFIMYILCQRKSYRKNQQLTEELHTVENGYHDNPTLEVMEIQPEMQEKKTHINGEFNDSWIVPIDNLIKDDHDEEEDTHL
ncbi:podocalyxin isoform X2 [Amia ocellicauda]|uniref:podocalyxin isoform X2 n=1 Tax=Amia ocellicauda TaxID=2972642 RepID=UPI0034639BFB